MVERLVRRWYDTLGSRYRFVLLAGEAGASVAVAVAAVVLIAAYYDVAGRDVLLVVALVSVLTLLSVGYAAKRATAAVATVERWRQTPLPTPRETVAAWEVATTFTLRQYQRSSALVNLLTVLPTCAVAAWLWGIGVTGFGAMVLACVFPAAYATVLSYSVGEILARPLIEDVAAQLPDEFELVARGLPLAKRLRLSVPATTTFTGLAVAAVVDGDGGSARLLLAVVVAAAVGLVLSHELTAILSASITRPISDVTAQLARVRDGVYDARAAVLSSDELGGLAHDFNRMAHGLAEREELRDAFGTYVDKDVMALILSGQFPQEGVEVDVSILFCDVRDFTSYAELAEATDVIATLNTLFAEIVPVVEAYGGHVDKFLGDGLLAVFGAPEVQPDHADRAVDAARMIVDTVAMGASGLRVSAGVNSGRVVAGPLGGAGRLNFSVIGDAVNVAARVEAATRATGDDVLLTLDTRAMLVRPQRLVSRGELPLKGKSEPVELFAQVPAETEALDLVAGQAPLQVSEPESSTSSSTSTNFHS